MKQFLVTTTDAVTEDQLRTLSICKVEEISSKIFEFYGHDFIWNTLDSYFDLNIANKFSEKEIDDIAIELCERAKKLAHDGAIENLFTLSCEDLENIVYEIVDDKKYASKFEE